MCIQFYRFIKCNFYKILFKTPGVPKVYLSCQNKIIIK